MELIQGVDLMSWLRDGDSQRLRDALAQLVTGLGALHEAGHVHRDIKPSNVLVADGRVDPARLRARRRGTTTTRCRGATATLVGTPDYMAPEQASSRPIGPEADFYSVGVMLYEALTGRLPIEGHALEVMMEKQRIVPAAAVDARPTFRPTSTRCAASCCGSIRRRARRRREILRRLAPRPPRGLADARPRDRR